MLELFEHEKLRKVAAKSQACGEFIEWLERRGYEVKHRKRSVRFVLVRALAEFFGIDEKN
jgi:hypothetical protein